MGGVPHPAGGGGPGSRRYGLTNPCGCIQAGLRRWLHPHADAGADKGLRVQPCRLAVQMHPHAGASATD